MLNKISKEKFQLSYTSLSLSDEQILSVKKYEKYLASDVSAKRKNDFLGGRWCAQECFLNLKVDAEIGMGDKGQPIWPQNYIGSITHSKDYALAVLAKTSEHKMLGCDLEKLVTEQRVNVIKKMTLTPSEVQLVESSSEPQALATLIFSAKETLYKMLYPHCQSYINFHEGVFLEVDKENGRYEIELVSDKEELKPFVGKYRGEFDWLQDNIVTISYIS